jgi:hypothetical protein
LQKTVSKVPLTVAAEKADALYRCGEDVRFMIQVTGEGAAFGSGDVAWTLSKDGLPPHQSGIVKLHEGKATITGVLNEPGFLQCRVKLEGATGVDAGGYVLGGAGVDPREIKPSLPVPGDFDEYWSELKGRLAKVPMNPKLVEVVSPIKNGDAFDLKLDSVGAPVSGYFVRPRGATPKSLPAILTVHGAGVRSSSLGGSGGWAAQGFLALDINAHGLPNGEKEEFYKALADGERLSRAESEREGELEAQPLAVGAGDPLTLQFADFVRAVRTGEQPFVDAEAGSAAVRTAERIVEAARAAGARMV